MLLDPLPDWLAPLRSAPALAGRLTWLDADERAAATATLQIRYAGGFVLGILWNDVTFGAARDAATAVTVVAFGPPAHDRRGTARTSLFATDGVTLWFTPDWAH